MVVLEDDTGEPSEAEATGDTGSPTTTSPTTSTTGTTGTTGTVTVSSSATSPTEPVTTTVDPTGGGEPGFCLQTCESLADCVPPGSNPDDFACIDGFCEYIAAWMCDETNCPPEVGATCAEVEGLPTCVFSCSEGGNECDFIEGQCTGVTDEGLLYCEAVGCGGGIEEGEPCFFEGFGLLGTCIDGLCVCTDDAECTAEGYACNA